MKSIGVIGIGKLGLCFALNLEKCGYKVVGVDTNSDYITSLNNKTFCSHEPKVNELLNSAVNFCASTKISDLITEDFDLLFVCVATPSDVHGGYEHSQIERVAEQIKTFGERSKPIHLVIVCTVTPGFSNKLSMSLSELNYTVSYNPEFIAQGNIIHNQLHPDQILIGEADKNAGDMIEEIYKNMCRNTPAVHRMDRLSAEITKLATNCFLTTKIAFANSIGDLATAAGADAEKILAAVGADSRIGDKYLKYGFGFGGPCLPRDNRALGYFAQTQNFDLPLGKSTDELNKQHLQFQLQQYLTMYSPAETIDIGSVAFKKGSVMLDESQKLLLAVELVKAGRKVLITDKQVVIDEVNRLYPNLFQTKVD